MEFPEKDSHILIVDDEEMVRSSLTSLLRLETDHKVTTADGGEQALQLADEHTFDLVITDYLMPGLSGIDLLARFKERQPQAPRILLTGYADKENAIRAINEVGIFQYLEKPWDNDHLLLVVRNALERRHLVRTLQEKIEEIERTHGQLEGLQKDILRAFI